LVADSTRDPAIDEAASLLRDPSARTEDIAGRVGLSERQLRRRSHAAIGYGPKTLQRILRFQRVVSRLDAAAEPPDLSSLAALAGYADQPHLTRECTALSGLTPSALARTRRPARRGPALSKSRELPGAPLAHSRSA
jgi:AraC-like DNA-binding protein